MRFNNKNFESPIEERLSSEMEKMIPDHVQCWPQFELIAHGKTYRPDFLLTSGNGIVMVEADGRQFHDYQSDGKRDMRILDDTPVLEIFRFSGSDIYFEGAACVRFLLEHAPQLSDPSRTPIGLESLWMAGSTINHHRIKPIVRMRRDLSDTVDHRSRLEATGSLRVIGHTTDHKHAVIQLQPPGKEWRNSSRNIWQLGDYMNFIGMTREEIFIAADEAMVNPPPEDWEHAMRRPAPRWAS